MHEELKMIPSRIRELREILGLTPEEVAQKLNIPAEQYRGYEDGSLDISISALYEIAAIFEVDFTVLLTGEAPRMTSQCVVRAGKGLSVDRYPGYSFSSLAYNFIRRVMEPMLVTIAPTANPPAMVVHTGQEFNYVLSGQMKVTVGQRVHLLGPGDSIYFDPSLPHGQEAVVGEAVFLTVIHE